MELISYQEFPKDPYTSAVCVIRFEGKYNVAYARKTKKDGGHFWSPPNIGVIGENNEKIYFDGFECDSKSFDKLVRQFLENVGKNQVSNQNKQPTYYPSGIISNQPLPDLTPSKESNPFAEQSEIPF